MAKTKVLILTSDDWTNAGWRFFKCIENLGFDAKFCKGAKHEFNYPGQGRIMRCLTPKMLDQDRVLFVDAPELKPVVEEADIVHFTASTFVKTGASLKNKKVVIQHGGVTYRKDPDALNEFYNIFADAAVIQGPDLLGLGAKNEHLIYPPVDLNKLQPDFERTGKKIRIGYFPSKKGMPDILDVIVHLNSVPSLKNKFEYVGIKTETSVRLPWEQHLSRVRSCDILIDACESSQGDKKYGEWGTVAIEAAALGKIVVTNSSAEEIYAKEYGHCALHIANAPEDLFAKLERIINWDDAEILKDKRKMRAWVKEKHSMKATGKRLWERIYSKF